MITDISDDELRQISVAWSYSIDFGFIQLQNIIIKFLKLRVSRGRKGRKEYVQIAQAEEMRETRLIEAQKRSGILSKK